MPGWPCRCLLPAIPGNGRALAAFAVSGFMAGKLLGIGLTNRQQGEPLGLPGAEKIIVPDDTVFALRIMAENARAHADMLFSLSGLYSFNLWTGLPTPTLANATQWFESLSPGQQQAIIGRLQADPRAALIVQLDTLGYLVQNGFRVRGALANYLAHEFRPAFKVDGYAFWVHRGRRVAALSTGRITAAAGCLRSQPAGAGPGRPAQPDRAHRGVGSRRNDPPPPAHALSRRLHARCHPAGRQRPGRRADHPGGLVRPIAIRFHPRRS